VGAGGELILPLEETWNRADDLVGGKARGLGRLMAAGYRVPPGFCISAEAYGRFLKARGLGDTIRMEIG
jgi:phosphoenolpyruvate synthase/pyruvate phosphate dikinase